MQLLTKVNILSDVYDRYVQFIETAWGKLQHIVAALAMHNRLIIPPHLNAPHVIMSMIQDIAGNSTVSNIVSRFYTLSLLESGKHFPCGSYFYLLLHIFAGQILATRLV